MVLSDNDIKKIIEGDSKLLVDSADSIGRSISRLSSSQIRRPFGMVKKMEMKYREKLDKSAIKDIMLLKPKLAYAAARDKSPEAWDLKDNLCKAIDFIKVETEGDFGRFKTFCSFFEAILAYHKVYGGK